MPGVDGGAAFEFADVGRLVALDVSQPPGAVAVEVFADFGGTDETHC